MALFLDNLEAHLTGEPFLDRFEDLHAQYKTAFGDR